MTNEEEHDNLDKLAEDFFKQIGIENFADAIEFAKNVEADVKKREITLPAEPLPDDVDKLKTLLREKEEKLIKFENEIAPALVLMIKEYASKNKDLLQQVLEKNEKIQELTNKIKEFKEKILGLKSKWF